MIPQRQLSKLSNRLFKEHGGHRIPEAVLERDYCISWFLIGLSSVSLRTKLAFKGGTALKRCHFQDYRFSEDLDFSLLEELSFDVLKSELEVVYNEIKKASGIMFKFSREDFHSHQNSYTFYLGYEGPLPARDKEVKVDVTIKECLVHPIENLIVLRSYPEYDDLPEDAKVRVYSLQEIATEKTIALLDRVRNEPRDLYDLWHLVVSTKSVNLSEIESAIQQKLAFRNKALGQVSGEFTRKEPRLKNMWKSRLSAQVSNLPEFEGVYRSVKRALRQAGIISKD